jgi:hypothetical protein
LLPTAPTTFYIVDRPNNRVLKVDAATGILTLVAGNGPSASSGDGGPALAASIALLRTCTHKFAAAILIAGAEFPD